MTSKAKGSALGCGGIALAGIAGLVGLYVLQDVTNAIFPGSAGIVRSASTAPYDIYLRVNLDMEDTWRVPPAEWHLRVPRSAIDSEYGSTGTLGDYKQDPFPYYAINIDAAYDRANSGFKLRRSGGNIDNDNIVINLTNNRSGVIKKGVERDLCQTGDDHFHYSSSDVFRCVSPLCEVYSSYQGWGVKVSVPSAITHSTQNAVQSVCDRVRALLAEYTVKIDDIR